MPERMTGQPNSQEKLKRDFAKLRRETHEAMKAEEEVRLKENPTPTEEELYMGAFQEWIEPQVREAIMLMNRKGYATQSSGFHGTDCAVQMVDGNFIIDEDSKKALNEIGIEVLRGADIDLPLNKLVTILRFRANEPAIDKIKEKWDAVAELLPEKTFPEGIRPISDRAEEFREQYAPDHPRLEDARSRYFEYMRRLAESER